MNKKLFLIKCIKIIGKKYILIKKDEKKIFLTDYRNIFISKTIAIIIPKKFKQIIKIIKLCYKYKISIIPQGGNTSLLLNSIPIFKNKSIILNLSKFNKILSIDNINNTILVESGCTLKNIKKFAYKNNLLFPLSLFSKENCTIGGNLAVNAGGVNVLYYGAMKDLYLGIKIINFKGTILNNLKKIKKNNTGYNIYNLFVNSEGILGIITHILIKLFSIPKFNVTIFVCLSKFIKIIYFFKYIQNYLGFNLTIFEFISKNSFKLVLKNFNIKNIINFKKIYKQYILLEITNSILNNYILNNIYKIINNAIKLNIIKDAIISTSLKKTKNLWKIRNFIPLAQKIKGYNIKHDISIPISNINNFLYITNILLKKILFNYKKILFGHIGDSNIHYNIIFFKKIKFLNFIKKKNKINRIIYDNVMKFGGSISAEHGLGILKNKELKYYKSYEEIKIMINIKKIFDPYNLFNPGKII